MTADTPPSPIWCDSRMAVWVNGGLVEVTPSDDFIRLAPNEAQQLAVEFPWAITEAAAWAVRWNPKTRTYDATRERS